MDGKFTEENLSQSQKTRLVGHRFLVTPKGGGKCYHESIAKGLYHLDSFYKDLDITIDTLLDGMQLGTSFSIYELEKVI